LCSKSFKKESKWVFLISRIVKLGQGKNTCVSTRVLKLGQGRNTCVSAEILRVGWSAKLNFIFIYFIQGNDLTLTLLVQKWQNKLYGRHSKLVSVGLAETHFVLLYLVKYI